MDSGQLNPLADAKSIDGITEKYPEVGELLARIRSLNPDATYKEVPPIGEFDIFDEHYVGADGKIRKPNPKYIPKHVAVFFRSMQKSYLKFLELHPEHVGEHGRPGLIPLSGYRSDYYQLAVMAKNMLTKGVDYTLTSMKLPGDNSDHANFIECGIDITTIGDKDGGQKHPDGRQIDLIETIEGQWLVKNAPSFGFFHPYPPDIDNPLAAVGREGIIPEPWHIKFVMDSEVAADRSYAIKSQESFRRLLSALGGSALL
jgi:hypothetical protein